MSATNTLHAITAHCTMRRPLMITSREGADIVMYKPARSSALNIQGQGLTLCPACWDGWRANTGQNIPGKWVRVERKANEGGRMCDVSDSRLYQAWLGVLSTSSIQPLEAEMERRATTLPNCAGEGVNYSEAYVLTVGPRSLPPIIPPPFSPGWVTICPFCYDWIDGTPVAAYFSKVTSPPTQKPKCHAWYHTSITWSLIFAAMLNDIDVFTSTVWAAIYFSPLTKTTNPGERVTYLCSTNGRRYNLTPAVPNFALCEHCVYMVVWAFPIARHMIQLDPTQNGQEWICDFDQQTILFRRHNPLLSRLVRSQILGSTTEFYNYVCQISKMPPCQGPRESPNEMVMYSSTTIPALDICEDCYRGSIEHGDFGALFQRASSGKRPENPAYNLVCDYSSPTVQKKYKAVLSDLENDDKSSFNTFCEWLRNRRAHLQTLMPERQAWLDKQKANDGLMAHKHMLAVTASSNGLALSASGTNSYYYGNDNLGWYHNAHQAQGAALSAQANRMLHNNFAQMAADVETRIQEWI